MNNIQIFNSEEFGAIRTAGTAETPLFCLSDLCRVLDLTTSKVAQRLEKGVLSKYPLPTNGGIQELNFVNEDGLYDVILDSRKPEAKAFRKWVTSEVLPSIRKSGGYIAAQADETPEQIMARALKVADETLKRKDALLQAQAEQIEKQTQEIAKIAPLADYTKDVLQSTSTYTLTQVSKDLGFRSVYEFTAWAKEHHILYRQSDQWMPTSQYSTNGWFTTRTFKYVKHDDSIGTSMTTVITEKGRKGLRTTLNSK